MTIKLRPYNPTVTDPPKWDGLVDVAFLGERPCMRAVFPDGSPVPGGALVCINERGLYRCVDVSTSLGLPLDRLGRLMLDGEPDYPARIAELEAEVARLKGSEAPPDKGAWQATDGDLDRDGACLLWFESTREWIDALWRGVPLCSWVREQPPPPPGGGA